MTRNRLRITIPSLLTALAVCASWSISHAGQKAELIDALVTAYHDNGFFSGAVLVADSGEVIYKKGIGIADRVWGVPNSPSTRFLIGSATKQFTAILVLQLAEENKLSLDDPITDHLPDYRQETGSNISIRQLLTHTSGIPDYFNQEFYEHHKDRFYSHAEFVSRFLSTNVDSVPAGSASYSSSNYYLLGLIIEAVTGDAYDKALRKRILDPLLMDDTGVDKFATVETNVASGYIKNYLGYWTPPFEIPESSAYSAGAMFSTVEDLYKFDQALHTDQLLPQSYIELVQAPGSSVQWNPQMYFALGSMVGDHQVHSSAESRRIHQFAGNTTTGFTGVITRIPSDHHLIAILCNVGPGYFNERLHDLTSGIISILYDVHVDIPRAHLEEVLGDIIVKSGIENAIQQYPELKDSGDYVTTERQMNQLGYDLLSAGRAVDAVAVFKLNVSNHPESINAYDSLADAYLRAGYPQLARKNYEHVLELDPTGRTGRNAREQLRILDADLPQ